MISSNRAASRFWTNSRIFLTVGVFTLIAGLGFSGCNSKESTNTANTNTSGSKLGGPRDTSQLTPFPSEAMNAGLKDTEGGSLKISEFAGKVLVINLWATWCGPCRSETPELIQISKEYKERGVEIIGLATEGNDADIQAVKDYLLEQKVPYRTIYDADNSFVKSLTTAVNARGVIPQSYVITRDGKILTHFEGYDPRSTPNKMRQMIDLALSYKT
jgi:thiol-disulfide isomerase/thioredoxin